MVRSKSCFSALAIANAIRSQPGPAKRVQDPELKPGIR